jgi:hypothetical protein
MVGPWTRGLEAPLAWRTDRTSRVMAAFDPLHHEGGSPMNRRTLRRALAVAVAIAAISPLFGRDPAGCARGNMQIRSAQQNFPSQTSEPHHR